MGQPRFEDQGGGEVDGASRGGGEAAGPARMQIRPQPPWSSREGERWRLGQGEGRPSETPPVSETPGMGWTEDERVVGWEIGRAHV